MMQMSVLSPLTTSFPPPPTMQLFVPVSVIVLGPASPRTSALEAVFV